MRPGLPEHWIQYLKGLDQETKEIVMADTRRRCAGRTVLFVTHDPAELEALGAVQRLELS